MGAHGKGVPVMKSPVRGRSAGTPAKQANENGRQAVPPMVIPLPARVPGTLRRPDQSARERDFLLAFRGFTAHRLTWPVLNF